MPLAVYKYSFVPADVVKLFLPHQAEILHCAHQPSTNKWCLWALVNTDPQCPQTEREILMLGTGAGFDSWPSMRHINSDISHGGALVFHFFEVSKIMAVR